jgi:transcription antitermination factor NusG
MPLLPLETTLFPEDLLRRRAEMVSVWWVLHTRPRAEKALTRQLLARELSFYLPLHERRWQSRGRSLSSYLPLFPSYVFLNGDSEARRQALETNLVAGILSVNDQAGLQSDLIRVQSLIEAGSPLTPEERLEPGTAVEIITGPLMGMQGTILRRGKRLKFLVAVHFLQQGVSIEVESQMIQALGPNNSIY